jgi:hypothetical protein
MPANDARERCRREYHTSILNTECSLDALEMTLAGGRKPEVVRLQARSPDTASEDVSR